MKFPTKGFLVVGAIHESPAEFFSTTVFHPAFTFFNTVFHIVSTGNTHPFQPEKDIPLLRK